ncbi:MAG: hypothetical protein ABIK20_02285 [Candidatus Omnitrophota bacterium]|nr:hypothetical protein [Candidatus Omnitrophota bacterium]
MIPIDLSLALGLYLLIGVGIMSLLWVVSESRRRAADLSPKENRAWACGLCLYQYIDSIAERFSRCPRCGNLNKK